MTCVNIEEKVEKVLKSRKNSKIITEIYKLMREDDINKIVYMEGLERIFTTFIQRGDFNVDESLKIMNEKEWEIEKKYAKWLQDTFETILVHFIELLDSNKKNVEDQALTSLMKFLSFEGKYLININRNEKIATSSFPEKRLEDILNILVSSKSRKSNVISSFAEYVKYDDIFFYTWKILKKIVQPIKESNDNFVLNLLELLEKIPLPKNKKKVTDSVEDNKTLCKPEDKRNFVVNVSQVQKFMRKVWQNLTNKNHSIFIHRKLMVTLLESYLQSLDNPIYLTDFFMASVNLGGANALLSLQGILILIQKHNMEYPNIYAKLYNMFEPNIFHTKYKSRLFYLADIFLSSSHLPENLVAGFAKRVARLCLNAKMSDIIISIRFIENLLLRHPGLEKMIHYPEIGQVTEDPFLPDECDPSKTRAIESCLWEIEILKNHVQPSVSSCARFIDGKLPSMEFDLSEVLDSSYEQIFKSESKKKMKAALNISRPYKIAKLVDDRVYKLWALT